MYFNRSHYILQNLIITNEMITNILNSCSCRGQTPADAEAHFLENSKKLALYGVEKYFAYVSDISWKFINVIWH